MSCHSVLNMGSQAGKEVLSQENITALSKSSGLEENDIITMYEDFLAKNPKGKMGREAFRKLMSQSLPKKDISKMEKHVFRIYDCDNDGFINFEEFLSVFHIMSDGSNEEVLRRVFRVFDVNSDGTMSRREMTQLVKDIHVRSSAVNKFCLEQKDFSKMFALKVIDILVEEN